VISAEPFILAPCQPGVKLILEIKNTMKSIAKRRFNYIDLVGIATSLTLYSHDYNFSATLIFIVGIILSVIIEQKYGKKV